MTPFAIAGVQMHVAALHGNVGDMRHRLDVLMARFPWTQMVLFSELAPFGPLTRHALPLQNEVIDGFREDARRHNIWLIPGSMFERAPTGGSTTPLRSSIPPARSLPSIARCSPSGPTSTDVEAGTEFCVFDVPGVGRFGLSICYDIWFPETTRQLTSQGVEVLLHPVLTGTTDRDAELAIARATAAQFQCYVFDVNGLGAGGVGRSCVVDPAATVLHQSAGQEDMFPIEVDLDVVRRQRETGMRGLGQVLEELPRPPDGFPGLRQDFGHGCLSSRPRSAAGSGPGIAGRPVKAGPEDRARRRSPVHRNPPGDGRAQDRVGLAARGAQAPAEGARATLQTGGGSPHGRHQGEEEGAIRFRLLQRRPAAFRPLERASPADRRNRPRRNGRPQHDTPAETGGRAFRGVGADRALLGVPGSGAVRSPPAAARSRQLGGPRLLDPPRRPGTDLGHLSPAHGHADARGRRAGGARGRLDHPDRDARTLAPLFRGADRR